MPVATIEDAGRVFTDPTAYADDERFHAACAVLRRESPVHRVEVEGFHPFWAVTRHADVMEVEKQHERFLNAPRPLLMPAEAVDRFHRLWTFGAVTAVASGLIGAFIPRPTPATRDMTDELAPELVVVDADLPLAEAR